MRSWIDERPRILLASWFLLTLAVLAGAPPAGAQAAPQKSSDHAARRQQAIALYRQHKNLEALPLLEKLAQEDPNDAVVLEALGVARVDRAATLSDPQAQRQELLRARQALLRAQELGDNSDIVQVLLEKIPEGAEAPRFSANPEVEKAMEAGEAAFARRDFAAATAAYQHALALDPKLYAAALFIGDVYFSQQQYDQAGQWFQKAIDIDPDQETAYRYWADALLADGQVQQAKVKYIQAVAANPYTRATWLNLAKWASQNGLEVWQPKIESPNQNSVENGSTKITINAASLDKKDGSSAWLLYDMDRALWKKEKFAEEFPGEKQYRHSLREEAEALGMVASSVEQQVKDKKVERLDPALATLIELKQKGLLEAYILVGRGDAGLAQDFSPYRKAHRDKLERYVAEYALHPKSK
jgi:tetratricopeptide (TPR) repeat protein